MDNIILDEDSTAPGKHRKLDFYLKFLENTARI